MEIPAIFPLAFLGKQMEVAKALSPASHTYPGNITIGTSHAAFSEAETCKTYLPLGSQVPKQCFGFSSGSTWHTDAGNDRGNKLRLFRTGYQEASPSLKSTLKSPPNVSEEKLNISLLMSWVWLHRPRLGKAGLDCQESQLVQKHQ